MEGLILAIAALLDFLIGDPAGWWHPVQGMGWAIARYTEKALGWLKTPAMQRLAGIGLGIGLIVGSGLVGWAIVAAAKQLNEWGAIAIEIILLASCFAARSLRQAAEEVLRPLQAGDLAQARAVLSRYVGRDTENLSEPDILRAVLETVTENATDGVMAPLFYALVGAAVPGVGSVPLALAYKAASTLDSMVGYKEAPYTDLGWFSARVEDGLNWLPCRLTVLTLSLLSGNPLHVWKLCLRDAPQDPSPNSGWSECAYAAMLGVQMGGTNWYRGVAKHKPLLGDDLHSITPKTVQQALQLTRYCFLIWLGLGICGSLLIRS
ncbi:adenosylcobinamide-phosphate synthase CbiB [Kovacikia minuta CCNUW1]|uniref:adenosylcobinamide-phosphate synthase CbiB n=1 Tax=Kovacikia minuta TaxID=2931930 RepID=UPI001CCFA796|nr:adenosylcobinamide-phosphate synthase CbiB [Kovacikia minuta]UBF27820.1 adenosylcobinamide-phosphate synthase CbiB [Kovacikia minuta CCNUW1]